MLAMGGFVLGSLIELLEILTGHHKHSQKQVEDYKNNS
jgi:hypothetical protein